jgi:NADH:ubiquinone reductase (H+-translocating)
MTETTRRPLRVVVLGGGWGAYYLTKALRGAIRRGEIALTVVSRDNYHTFHGFIAEMLTGRIQPGQIMSPARRIFAPGRFHCAEVESIDLEAKQVTTSRMLDGREFVLDYDHLVLTLGSRDDLTRIPGLAEHALRLRNYADAYTARNHFIDMMEMAEIETDPEERRRLLTFVVVGGGYGGIEVATELDDYTRGLTRKMYPGIDPDEIRVMVVHSGEHVLPELAPHHVNLQRWAEEYLATQPLEVRTSTRLVAATPEEAILSDGEHVPTRTIVSCAGVAMSPLLDHLDGVERDERGRVITDACGQVEGVPGLWAAGDCAALPHPKGGTCPQLAIYAMRGGDTVGRNLARLAAGEPLKPLRFTGLGDACSLGRRRAVAHIRGIPLKGRLAWVVWRTFFLGFIPTWDRRLRLLLDWVLMPLAGREVAQLRLGEEVGIRRELYEPGQLIVREGDVGRRLSLVYSGEVEVFTTAEDGTETTLAVLGPGDHFGETSVFDRVRRTASVRARTRVEVVSLGRREALALSDTLSSFSETVRRLPRSRASTAAPKDLAGSATAPSTAEIAEIAE